MVVPVAIPLSIVHAASMHQHQELARQGRITVLLKHTRWIAGVNPLAAIAQTHIDCERVSSACKVVAIHAVRYRSVCVSGRRGLALRQRRCHRCEADIDGLTNETNSASNTTIDEAGNAARTIGLGNAKRTRAHLYSPVHLLDDLRRRLKRVKGHTRGATEIRKM